MELPNSSWHQESSYRYGYNGKEKDKDWSGYDYGARLYDEKIGRWRSRDFFDAKYPYASPYNFALNTPIQAYDPDGNLVLFVSGYWSSWMPLMPDGFSLDDYWGEKFVQNAREYFQDSFTKSINGKGSIFGTGKDRYNAGYEYAKANFDKLTENMVEGETIKVVSHSMGAAYSEGMIKYFEERGKVVEKVIHLSAADTDEFEASPNPKTLQLNLKWDPVLGARDPLFLGGEDPLGNRMIKGVDMFGEADVPFDLYNHTTNQDNTQGNTWDKVSDLENIKFTYLRNESLLKPPSKKWEKPLNLKLYYGVVQHGTQFTDVMKNGKVYTSSYRYLKHDTQNTTDVYHEIESEE